MREHSEGMGWTAWAPVWQPIETVPIETPVLLWLVTENPENSGAITGTASIHFHGQFWADAMYRPLAWCSHWMPLPEPPAKPWKTERVEPRKSLLRPASESLPTGCFCEPGKCMSPVIMGKQMPCRDPEKAKGGGE